LIGKGERFALPLFFVCIVGPQLSTKFFGLNITPKLNLLTSKFFVERAMIQTGKYWKLSLARDIPFRNDYTGDAFPVRARSTMAPSRQGDFLRFPALEMLLPHTRIKAKFACI